MTAVDPGRRTATGRSRDAAAIINHNGGGRYGPLVVAEARRAGLELALACALVQQESDFRNIFGADAVDNPIPKRSPVTKASYERYRAFVAQGFKTQGVGLTQLTFKGFQDRADRLGGCWKPRVQLQVGFSELKAMIARHGTAGGLSVYNAGSPTDSQGRRYAAQVLAKRERWRALLKGAAIVTGPARTDPRTLRRGRDGADVELLQRTLNRYLQRWGAAILLDVDGDFGPRTELAFRRVRLVLGLRLNRDGDGRVLVSPRDRIVLRNPRRRTAAERLRARERGRPYLARLKTRFAEDRKQLNGRPKIIRLALDFDDSRLARNTEIHTTVGHHAASARRDRSDADCVQMCRAWHRDHRVNRGWAGIGYHACIASSGTIILLRPGWAKGAGVENHNTGTFHIVFPGNYERDKPTAAQIASYRWFLAHGHELAGVPRQGARQLGHRDFAGHETNACPGRFLHPFVKGTR